MYHIARVFNKIYKRYQAPAEYRVFPHCHLPPHALNGNLDVSISRLIKGYLGLGAYIAGQPAWDADFNCADFFVAHGTHEPKIRQAFYA